MHVPETDLGEPYSHPCLYKNSLDGHVFRASAFRAGSHGLNHSQVIQEAQDLTLLRLSC